MRSAASYASRTASLAAPTARGRLGLAPALGLLLALATLGEGGGSVASLLAWHTGLALLLVSALVARRAAPCVLDPGPALIPAAVWLVLVAAGAVRAPYAYAAWSTCFELGALLAVLVLAARSGPALLPWARWTLGTVALVQLVAGLRQIWLLDSRAAGSFLNPNHLGAWAAMVALLLISGLELDRGARARTAAFGLALAAGLLSLLSGSRGALAGLALGLALLARLRWSRWSKARRRVVLAFALVGALVAAAAMARRLEESDPFRYQRLRIWRASTQLILDSPWWGSGPGQFGIAAEGRQFADGRGALQFDRHFSSSHSDLLRAGAELGVPAALALLAAFALAARTIVKRRRNGAGSPLHDGALAALVVLLAQSLVDNPSQWPGAYLLGAALGGVLLAAPAASGARWPGLARAAWAALLLGVLGLGELAPALAHFEARSVPGRGVLGELDRARLARARRLNPWQPDYAIREVQDLLEREAPWALSQYLAAREQAEAARRLSPRSPRAWWTLARVEARGCLELFHDEASRARALTRFESAMALAPGAGKIALDAGEFLLAASDPAGARRLAEAALRLEPDAAVAHLLLGRALIEQDPAAPQRAATELARAEALAAEHRRTASSNSYAREMLSLDPRQVERLRARLPGTVRR